MFEFGPTPDQPKVFLHFAPDNLLIHTYLKVFLKKHIFSGSNQPEPFSVEFPVKVNAKKIVKANAKKNMKTKANSKDVGRGGAKIDIVPFDSPRIATRSKTIAFASPATATRSKSRLSL